MTTKEKEVRNWHDDAWDPITPLDTDEFEAEPPNRRGFRWLFYLVALLVLAALITAGGVGLWYMRQVNPPGQPGAVVTVTVDEGMTVAQLAKVLQSDGVITSASVFRFYIDRRGGLKLQPGYYAIRKKESMGRIASILETPPSQTFTKVTFPEGFTLHQIAARLESTVSRMSAADLLAAASSGSVRSRYQPQDITSLEGLLFPDTYQVAGNETADSVVKRMVGLMDRVAATESIDEAPDRLGVTPYQVLIIASIIEREAKVGEDRGKIARVIYNRLRDHMLLEIDATLLYAAPDGTTGVTKQLIDSLDSPYNTYKVFGLPPTPIASPGRASIRAAMNPTDGPWLYYVIADASGRHAFATTLAEHDRNVAAARALGLIP